MSYWIFTVTGHKIGSETFTAEEIFNRRMKDGFWGIGEKTPNRKNLTRGDRIIVIAQYLVGRKILNTKSEILNKSQWPKLQIQN